MLSQNESTYIYNFVGFHQKVWHLLEVCIVFFLLEIGVLILLSELLWIRLTILTTILAAYINVIARGFSVNFAISGHY